MSEGDPKGTPFPPLREGAAGARGGSDPGDEVPAARHTDVSDEALMMCVQGGDLRSLQELLLRYQKALYNFLARYTGDVHLAEDIFQECFLRLVQARGAFDPTRGFRPWLYSVAANLARDACRRREVRNRETSRARPAPSGESLGPEQEAERIEEAELVRKVVDELPGDARAMVLLHFFQGLTYREISSALEVPIGTVKSRVHWAVQKLADKWNARAGSVVTSGSSRKR